MRNARGTQLGDFAGNIVPAAFPSKLKASRMHGSKVLHAALFSLLAFALSYMILPYYTYGDQIFYRAFYDVADQFNLIDAYRAYGSYIGASEPGYFIVVYSLSSYVPKDVLMSALNAALSFSLAVYLLRKQVSLLVLWSFAPNFYLLVLYFSAERLKLAALLLVISALFSAKRQIFLLLLAILSHVQSVVIAIGELLNQSYEYFPRLMHGVLAKQLFLQAILALALFLSLFFMADVVATKYEIYSSRVSGYSYMLKPLVFLFASMYYARGKAREALLIHLPILLAAFLIGGERMVIFSYFVFAYYAIEVNRGINLGILFTSFYFGFKGYEFIQDIVTYGNGFYEIS